ncbi:hypothetical protein LJR230_005002 [Trinickia sp. LjRoot230]|uniref:hypothetical protein n=1 Tax=Trinickia sp. LjRoot230 TaxID=3342288 RepID=UPI003ECE5936
MSIPPISGASGAPRDDDPSPAADDKAPPRPTRQPQQDQFGGFRSSPRQGRSGAPPDAEVVVSRDGSSMSVTATGGSTVFAAMGGNVIVHNSSGSPQPSRNTGGLSPRIPLVNRMIDAIYDSYALESVVNKISRAPEQDKPALLAATAKRVTTLLKDPNSWTDSEKIDAFIQLVSGATDALNSSHQPDFERYAEATAAFAELVPHLPVNDEVPSRYLYLAGLMVEPPLPPQHLEALTNALFHVAKDMPQPAAHNLFLALTGKMEEIKKGERAPMLNAMASNLGALEHRDELGSFLLLMAASGYEESETLGRSVLPRVIDRFGPYLDACKEGLSDMGDETKNFYFLLHLLEQGHQREMHAPTLAGFASMCGKLALNEQGPAFDKILEYATRSGEPSAVLKSLIDVFPTIQATGHEDRHRRLCEAIEACGKPQSDELFARLFNQHRPS